jgi:hypothetical protein
MKVEGFNASAPTEGDPPPSFRGIRGRVEPSSKSGHVRYATMCDLLRTEGQGRAGAIGPEPETAADAAALTADG